MRCGLCSRTSNIQTALSPGPAPVSHPHLLGNSSLPCVNTGTPHPKANAIEDHPGSQVLTSSFTDSRPTTRFASQRGSTGGPLPVFWDKGGNWQNLELGVDGATCPHKWHLHRVRAKPLFSHDFQETRQSFITRSILVFASGVLVKSLTSESQASSPMPTLSY